MSRIFGEAGQIAWVVPDIHAAMKHWVEVLGIGPWLLLPHRRPTNFVCDGEPSDIDFSLAFAYSGEIQFELIEQHNDAPSLYADVADSVLGSQHHVGYFVRDYDERRQRALEAGYAIGQEGALGPTRFAYFRTNRVPGTYAELIHLNDELAAGFEARKAAARSWDGTDPILTVDDGR